MVYIWPDMAQQAGEVIGRAAAKAVLAEAYQAKRASLVSVVGRRRIGKTFLVKQVYANDLVFSVTGIAGAPLPEQLYNFATQIATAFGLAASEVSYSSWLEALGDLAKRLDARIQDSATRKVIFFDELPWLASRRSGFLRAFSWFWNSWAVDRNVVVVICGSAASWMIKKVVRDRGGLHNRITHRIKLDAFTFAETSAFMDSRGIVDDVYQRLQLYMALGGVPFYLEQIRAGESAQQAIERLLFSVTAVLADEFRQLYHSLFERADHHVDVVKTLAKKQRGMTRGEILSLSNMSSSGTLTRVLEELELSGFILRTTPFGKKRRDALYRLIDEYSRFYLLFLAGHRPGDLSFIRLSTTSAYRSWQGYAFENVALRNLDRLRAALGIAGVDVLASSFVARAKGDVDGVQIDLLLDRADRIITLIEVKFTEEPFVLSKSYAKQLREKKQRFKLHTRTKKAVTLVLLTTFGVQGQGGAGIGIVDRVLDVEALLES